MPTLILFILGIWLVSTVVQKLTVWCNRNIFSKIWHEETAPVVARETLERLKEMLVDGEVPEETAVLLAAKEQNITEQELLNAFSADDAKDLMSMLSHKKPNMLPFLMKKLAQSPKQGMRR